jgi:hypothetical protein
MKIPTPTCSRSCTRIKNAPPAVVEDLLRDSKVVDVLVPEASRNGLIVREALRGATRSDLYLNLPEAVTDDLVARRIKKAPAQLLITWLGQGHRLGFREGDILRDDQTLLRSLDDEGPDQDVDMADGALSAPATHLVCPNCDYAFTSTSGYNYVSPINPHFNCC